MADKEIDQHSGVETTGHEWDGIKELNNPLPRWWLIIFYATIVWAVVYWVLMPAWPGITGHTKGLRNHSERANVAGELAALDAARSEKMSALLKIDSIDELRKNEELAEYARVAGESLFGDNCATCHGAGGQGFKGYPALVDDVWLWGGSLEDIQRTLHFGIRAEHVETRNSLMQAYGASGILNREQIADLVEYVVSLSGGEANTEAVARATPLFAQQCAVCHGAEGGGDQSQGAPNLTDVIWLYGGERTDIQETLYNGRAGVMPAWTERLSDEEIVALAVYVQSLGGGE